MSEEIRVASEFYRPIPQPHEPWTPTYTNTLAYKMAPGEKVPLWFRVKSSGPVTLALGGSDASKYSTEFFKPFGQVVDNSDAYKRASLTSSPVGTYYDPLNPIPTGTSNFTPEVPDGYEFVYLLLTCNSTTTTGNHSLTVSLGSDSITITIHVWSNITLPAAPTRPLLVNVTSGTANKGVNGSYISDAKTVSATLAVTDLLVKYRVTPYLNGMAFLPVTAGKLDIDYLSSANESYRQMLLNHVATGDIKFWMAMPETQAAHRTLVYAQAAEAAITANSLTNMYVYVWDEPTTDVATATAIKAILDNWKAGSPSTKLFLTTNKDYFSSAGAISAGLVLSDYGSQLVLSPVINQVGGTFTAITGYTNNAFGFYSSCQGNCGPATNANSTTGTDQGLVDFAYIDYPMVRRYAAYMLAMRTNWRDKTALMLHYDSTQAWGQFSGTTSSDSQNPWLSARRFKVMGDGTLVYPGIPGYKPHVGIPAFVAGTNQAVPSIRLLYIAHASYMADLFQAYLTAQSSHQADNLITDQSTFHTVYQDYESLRDKIGTAIQNSTTIAAGANPIETSVTATPPATEPPAPTAPIVPPADPSNPVQPPVTPVPVVPPPLPQPPVIPQPPVTPPAPVTGGSSGPSAPDLPSAIPSLIEGPSGRISILNTAIDECYATLSNSLYKFSRFSGQYSLGALENVYLQIPVATRVSDKTLKFSQNLVKLPPADSGLIDFFTAASTAADYGNGSKTRTVGPAASLSGGYLVMNSGTESSRGVIYGTSNDATGLCPLIQTGTVRLLYVPSYTGNPGTANDVGLYYSRTASANTSGNQLLLKHSTAGVLSFLVGDSTNAASLTASAAWAPVANQEYIIDATFDLNQGLVEIWVDGTFTARVFGSTALTRSNATARVLLGADALAASGLTGNHKTAGITLFNTYRAWDKWVMMGIPVGERFNLTAFNMSYGLISDEQDSYKGAGSPGGGANL